MKTIYILCGCSGSGKTWVCSQILDSFTYISYDKEKKYLIEKLQEPSVKPFLFDPCANTSTYIRRLVAAGYDVVPVFIHETDDTLTQRIESRSDGKKTITLSISKRNLKFKKYGDKFNGFVGTSSEVLKYMKSEGEKW